MIAGLSRRQLLGIGGVIAVGAAGVFFFRGGGDGVDAGDTPAGTAEAFVTTLDDGNAQQAIELLHSNSPVPESTIQTLAQRYGQVDTSIGNPEVVEQSDGEAIVEVPLSVEGRTLDPMRISLRTSSGEWRVYSFPGPV